MIQKILEVISILVIVLFSNCVTNRIYFTEKQIKASTPTSSISQPFFLWGIGQEKEIDATTACGKQKPAKAHTTFTVLDSILGICTLGLYTPRTVEIYCE